jgi:hypothetical protein
LAADDRQGFWRHHFQTGLITALPYLVGIPEGAH